MLEIAFFIIVNYLRWFLARAMALTKCSRHTDVHGWICDLPRAFKSCSIEITGICLKRKILLRAETIANGLVRLQLLRDSEILCELGEFCIGECGVHKLQNLLFSRLCIHTFLRLTHKNIMGLKELMRMDIAPRSVEASKYKEAFNKLFYAACYFHLFRDSETDLNKLAAETLHIIRPPAAYNLVRALASELTEIRWKYEREDISNDFKISYSSNLDGVGTVHCLCPCLSMKRIHYMKINKHLDHALSYHLLECNVDFCPEVKFHDNSVDVEMKIKKLHCRAVQLDPREPIQDTLRKNRYVPVNVIVTMGPDPVKSSTLHRAILGCSLSNTTVNYSQINATEGAVQVQLGTRSMLSWTGKKSRAKNITREFNPWHFEPSASDNIQGKFQWTLYHPDYEQEPVFEYHPKSSDRKQYQAFTRFVNKVGPSSAFTAEGGVEFAEDLYGTPVKWTFDKSVKELDWIVKLEITMAFYSPKCMEIRYQKFDEMLRLSIGRNASLPISLT